MELHHSKHHNTYVTNLNNAEETLNNALAKNDVKGTIASQSAIKFNGGGESNPRKSPMEAAALTLSSSCLTK